MTKTPKKKLEDDKKRIDYLQQEVIEGEMGKGEIDVVYCKKKVPLMPINVNLYKPKTFGTYIPIGEEKTMLKAAITRGMPYLIEGDKGLGKTMAVYEVCAENGMHIVPYSCSSGTTLGDILGREHLLGDDSVFELGILPKAIEIANKTGKAILYLDEINALEPEIQKQLNPVIDDRRSIIVADKMFEVKEGVIFGIVATCNPSSYGGTNPLNEDLRSRFIGEMWEYPSGTQLSKVIDWTGIPVKTVQQPLLQLAVDTLALKKQGKAEYVISIRDIALFVKAYRMWKETFNDDEKALIKAIQTAILIKFADSEERDTIRQRAEESFGVKVK